MPPSMTSLPRRRCRPCLRGQIWPHHDQIGEDTVAALAVAGAVSTEEAEAQGLGLFLATYFSVGRLKMSPGEFIANFLIKWNQENYILLRIRVIVAFLISLYALMMLFSGIFLFAMKRSMLSFLDAVTDAILVYVMGVMQAAPFKNQLFPVWALMLVSFRSSINCLSSYGTFFELRNSLKLLAVAYLNITHGSKLWHVPFWLFWSLLALNCCYRILARHVASKSLWNGRSSELLQEYMGANGNESNFNPERCNPETMEGYKYFVYGESQKSRMNGHSLSVKDLRTPITLDKIWQCECDDDMLLSSIKRQGKDLSLSFALSRLLRCRLEGAKLHADTVSMTRKLISKRILAEDPENEQLGIRILELDVEFLRDSLHTSYPMVFCSGFLSLSFTILACLVKFLVVLWLYKDISKVYSLDLDPLSFYKDFNKRGLRLYIDETRITTYSLTSVIILETWEVLTYFESNWTRLLAMCKFVNCRNRCLKFVLNMLFRFHYMLNLVKRFDISCLQQCPTMFMRSFGFCSTMFKWEMTPFIKGRNPNESVKARVIQALRSMDLEGHPLSKDLPSPRLSVRAERYWLASVADVPRCSRVILVWHIATCLCEIKFANDSFTGCCLKWMSMLPSTEVDETDDELDKSYAVTYYLSRYCMHLLVSKRKLLPEDILVSKKTLQDTVQCAREMLKGCNSFQSVYDKLMEEPQKALVPDAHDMNLSGNILQQGAIMANALIVNEEDEACRWEILAEVWAHLIVHIAPSSRIEAHAENLKSGSEFITVIWALFSHCGIEKSELWQ
ncbi:Os11g0618700 [Oryza sativa Japonica Group]|uniref:Os11g0618700 protein n=1 Tax=Oryza sativa subsp. japonica TaxID=39947 RepID=C7J967_ORYSJ|nr:Os11g0618700 [Oryza sativa Japonica Group]|eukprot:NP_001176657.1 Os11g0618700 [Oryza sativa Japonica Group]